MFTYPLKILSWLSFQVIKLCYYVTRQVIFRRNHRLCMSQAAFIYIVASAFHKSLLGLWMSRHHVDLPRGQRYAGSYMLGGVFGAFSRPI